MLNSSIISVAADTFIRSSMISFNNASQMSGIKDTLFGFEEVGGGISLGRINCSTLTRYQFHSSKNFAQNILSSQYQSMI